MVHSVRNNGFVQMVTTVMKYALSFWKFAVLNFDGPCASTEYRDNLNLNESPLNGAEVIVSQR